MDLNLKIKTLLSSQKFAVLSTQSEKQPYSNLVTFAACEGRPEVVFFTPRNTRKFQNLLVNPKVALLIDNRTNQSQDFQNATAVTIIGSAEEIDIIRQKYYIDVFSSKHPNLADLIKNRENAFFKVIITDYIVATFDQTVRVTPDSPP